MAPVPPTSDLQVNKPEAGWQFRLEMFVTNAVLGYWKYAAMALVIVLVGVLFYSVTNSMQANKMKAGASEIAEIERVLRNDLEADLPPDLQKLGQHGWDADGLNLALRKMPREELQRFVESQPGVKQLLELSQRVDIGSLSQVDMILIVKGTPSDATRARLVEAGKALEAVAANYSSGAGAAAALDAAEIYRHAGDTEGRKRALLAASAVGAGALHASAEMALAGMEIEDAATRDAGIERLVTLVKDPDGSVAETATIELVGAYVAAGRKDDANLVIGDYNAKWPDSKRKGEIERLEQRLKGEGGDAPAAPKPEENPLAPEPAPEGPTAPGQP